MCSEMTGNRCRTRRDAHQGRGEVLDYGREIVAPVEAPGGGRKIRRGALLEAEREMCSTAATRR